MSKNWASEYLLDPLTEPTPAEETGPGTSLRPNSNNTSPVDKNRATARVKEQTTGASTTSTNPFRRKSPGSTSPPASISKSKASTSIHSRAWSLGSTSDNSMQKFPPLADGAGSPSHSRNSSPSNNSLIDLKDGTRARRSSSLRERYPGDTSHKPLNTLTKEQKRANRSSHLRKKHHHGADSIDKLDDAWITSYHHESPYDAASLARNNSFESGPVAALEESNLEALKATPRENVQDSLRSHRPLDGVAYYPPGLPDPLGRVYQYKEGTDLMIEEGGNYKRWPGVDYHPDDLKGKGEPSYTIEKQLKEHDAKIKPHTRGSPRQGEYELVERPRTYTDRPAGKQATVSSTEMPSEELGGSRRRVASGSGLRSASASAAASGSGSTGNGVGVGGQIKRRLGSLRRRDRAIAIGDTE